MSRCLHIAKHLSDAFVQSDSATSGTPWRAIKGMRNLFAHDYHSMNYDVIWETATENIPALEAHIRSLMEGQEEKQYGTKLVKIPAPHFYALYIGDDMDVDEDTLKLSAAFKESGADLELVCHVFNITYKEHRSILERCRPLHDYSYFVHRIDEDKKRGMTLDEAIRETMAYCIAHGVMKEFLESHWEEVLKMFALKWDTEEEKKVLREEGREEGMIAAARSLMETLHCTKEKAMELLKIPAELRPKVLALL